MPDIQVYDKNGEPYKKFFINDDVEYVHGRVYKGKSCYYKGIGVPYRSHHILSENITDEYDHIKNSDVFYVGHAVSKKCFSGNSKREISCDNWSFRIWKVISSF